MWLIKQNNNSV